MHEQPFCGPFVMRCIIKISICVDTHMVWLPGACLEPLSKLTGVYVHIGRVSKNLSVSIKQEVSYYFFRLLLLQLHTLASVSHSQQLFE